jgi:hypothetical protein
MTHQPRPAVGYLREYRSMTRHQLAAAKEQLSRLAGRQGLALREIFAEQPATDPAAFDALIKVVKRRKIPVVIVLTPTHLSAVGSNETKAQWLHRETDAHAVAAHGSPS